MPTPASRRRPRPPATPAPPGTRRQAAQSPRPREGSRAGPSPSVHSGRSAGRGPPVQRPACRGSEPATTQLRCCSRLPEEVLASRPCLDAGLEDGELVVAGDLGDREAPPLRVRDVDLPPPLRAGFVGQRDGTGELPAPAPFGYYDAPPQGHGSPYDQVSGPVPVGRQVLGGGGRIDPAAAARIGSSVEWQVPPRQQGHP